MRDAEGRVWLGRSGHADLSHPWERREFRAVRFTETKVVLDLGIDRMEVDHARLLKLEFSPEPYDPRRHEAFRSEKALGRPAE